ncbi:MAG: hypothetical protein N3B12_04040 [Armatimonadetes bacterium]|nr:hypothetical protein [Armatimonadota bacterium]
MRTLVRLMLVAAMVMGLTTCASAGTCIYGLSGFIETPDDTTAGPSAVTFAGRYVADLGDSKFNLLSYGGTVGIVPKLEVGAVGLDSDAPGASVKGILNVKFRVVDESLDRPSVTIGVVDLANNLGDVSRGIDKTSMFLIIGRNLSSIAENWGSLVSTPLRGTIGVGTGVYKGVFFGVNWSPSSKIEIMGEYLSEGIRRGGSVNAGVRVNVFGGLSIEVGTLGFKDLYGGASYSLSMY